MKAIKIILGIITAIVVIFFITGLFIKETKFVTKVTIQKPVENVFVYLKNQQKFKEWMPEIVSLTPLLEKTGKIGSSYLLIVKKGDTELKIKQKILAFIPNKKITFTFETKDLFKKDEYKLTNNRNETLIKKTSIYKSKSYIMSCVFPYFKSKLQNEEQLFLDRLKNIVENN